MFQYNRNLLAGSVFLATLLTPNAFALDFLTTDGATLYRANSTGTVYGSTTMNTQVQSLTTLPSNVTLAGASAGDIIASARSAASGRWAMYRLDDPFGAATLTQIGSLNKGIGSLTFANGRMYGVDDSLSALRIYELDLTTGNAITTYNTGVTASGGGGLAFDDVSGLFYLTDYNANRLYSWTPAAGATLIGPLGFAFSNNGLEFFEGALYGGFRQDTGTSTMRLGSISTTTGAFTTMTTISGITGSGTGFVVVPEPGTLAALGLAALVFGARRKKAAR
ncbi:MAG TPA: PEP-CTERM sorting domain-containing protein [Fimbriimonadaceae bacterium]|nr:PEP-CTERM sorting domain-containing protein [Fimbriimonadaceae bacterium]